MNVLMVFLHVFLALAGAALWIVGAVLLGIMWRNGRIEELRGPSVAFLVFGGILLTLMQLFASLAYAAYFSDVKPVLDGAYPFLSLVFEYKVLISSIASLIGLSAVAVAWSTVTKAEAALSFTLSLITMGLFSLDAVLAVWVMSTVSV